jgi:GNAT superfamily N-acetyltransferase
MPFLNVDPDDGDRVASAADLLNRAHALDDPDAAEVLPDLLAGNLRYGWDLEPSDMLLYVPEGSSTPVGLLEMALPRRDNVDLVWADLTVHPDHRRQGHGSVLLGEVIRHATSVGRHTLWLGTPEDDPAGRAFAERHGFRYANHDARRRQVLADVDPDAVDRLHGQAEVAAADYVLERGIAPTAADVLEELVEVTAAINDAPMGELTYEHEVFDLKRLQDFEAAAEGRGDRVYRIWARHRVSGEVGGHTVLAVNPLQPEWGWQGDTAVSRGHRGHRLGMLVKIEMMRWLAEEEPGLKVVETWNQADNRFMVDVNEALGYRLSRVFDTYERIL